MRLFCQSCEKGVIVKDDEELKGAKPGDLIDRSIVFCPQCQGPLTFPEDEK